LPVAAEWLDWQGIWLGLIALQSLLLAYIVASGFVKESPPCSNGRYIEMEALS